jgi:hypothetical protein
MTTCCAPPARCCHRYRRPLAEVLLPQGLHKRRVETLHIGTSLASWLSSWSLPARPHLSSWRLHSPCPAFAPGCRSGYRQQLASTSLLAPTRQMWARPPPQPTFLLMYAPWTMETAAGDPEEARREGIERVWSEECQDYGSLQHVQHQPEAWSIRDLKKAVHQSAAAQAAGRCAARCTLALHSSFIRCVAA